MSKAVQATALARKQAVIENPILNSPFEEPTRHFRFDESGITNETVNERRLSSYFVPIPQARKKSKLQLQFDSEWTADRIQENAWINKLRAQVKLWRQGGYAPKPTNVTRALQEYWQRPERRSQEIRGITSTPRAGTRLAERSRDPAATMVKAAPGASN
jgi:type III restriction enzyme